MQFFPDPYHVLPPRYHPAFIVRCITLLKNKVGAQLEKKRHKCNTEDIASNSWYISVRHKRVKAKAKWPAASFNTSMRQGFAHSVQLSCKTEESLFVATRNVTSQLNLLQQPLLTCKSASQWSVVGITKDTARLSYNPMFRYIFPTEQINTKYRKGHKAKPRNSRTIF